MGFIITTCGTSCCHMVQKVLRDIGFLLVLVHNLQYLDQKPTLVALDGSSWMSNLWYPGMRPGKTSACSSARVRIKQSTSSMVAKGVVFGGSRFLLPCTQGVNPAVLQKCSKPFA